MCCCETTNDNDNDDDMFCYFRFGEFSCIYGVTWHPLVFVCDFAAVLCWSWTEFLQILIVDTVDAIV